MDPILVVDDSVMNQMALRKILSDEFEVVCASSGKEMFQLLENMEPKLILLDIIMPDLDGFAIIEKLKASEDYAKIPVIFITGLDDASSEEKGFQLGAIDYITKPFRDNVVKARVRSYVQLYDFVKKAELLGQKDGLTGLFNKKTTEDLIRKCLGPKSNLVTGALMIIDVDNFKSINDTFGHLYGDAVIAQLADVLKQIFQKSDVIGRVGGDEFFVFLKNYGDSTVLEERAKEVCERFNKLYVQKEVSVQISASVGIATTEEDKNFETIYKNADIALYNTKARGKNGYAFYTGKEELIYQATRTEIESSGSEQKNFNENMREYIFNLLYESKDAENTVQSVLQLICEHFAFSSGYITKLKYEDYLVECIYNWEHADGLRHPAIRTASFLDFSKIYKMFEDEDFVVLDQDDIEYTQMIGTPEITTRYLFGIKHGKILLGYIGFEKFESSERDANKICENIAEICQRLCIFIINQFLLQDNMDDRKNAMSILDAIDEAIYVVRPSQYKVIFSNEAARKKMINPRALTCYKKLYSREEPCLDCPMNPDNVHDTKECKEISWSSGGNANIIYEH